ncbi:DNA primase [Candidatus Sulfidibacterium hydrothermale]|uniref:DNA primase n=1 Tax=Candidatus Sulfidibacterium hydrothermale TaxID=2875962 RepID=UPI001F0A9634|nr:DNA primase [Candidatus Sulfidibacterium hydrothermale]UBM62180.1 DNA primase [Candidatus Sulfidibacterium hydrothermale]
MIKPETIQKIFDAARIEEVVGDFVTLKKRGVNYIGLCPFHNEKTPSFTVSPAKGIFKCFGCGKAGNAVKFVMEHEHYSYPEALKYLARKYGIDVEETELSDEEKQQMDEREALFALNTFMSDYFQEQLFQSEEGKAVGLTYFKERGFLEATIKKFQLGYAHDAWEKYSKYALEHGYSKDVLVKTGLSIDKGNRLMDRFRGRVMFPIHNLTGKVIGFGGRILSSEKSTAKYVNSPESEIYNKSKSLYGIFFARNAIVKQDNCYLVEGYTDVISLHQAGIENVVASSGTSLTEEQIKLIKRFTPNITILYDGDAAGIKASFRGIDLILYQGMNVKIVLFPDGEDPDSYARSHTSSELENFIRTSAVDFIKFKTRLLLDETLGDPVAKVTLIKDIVQTIAHIPEAIQRTVYIQECSAMMDIPEQTLMNELNKLLREKYRKKLRKTTPEQQLEPESAIDVMKQPAGRQNQIDPLDISEHEKQIMRLLLLYGNRKIQPPDVETEKIIDEFGKEVVVVQEEYVAKYVLTNLENDGITFENKLYNQMADEIKKMLETGKVPDEQYFTQHMDDKIADEAISLIATPYELSSSWKKNKIYVKSEEDDLSKTVVSTLNQFRIKVISRYLREITEKMKTTSDEAEIFILQQQFFELKKVAKEIDNELHRIFDY